MKTFIKFLIAFVILLILILFLINEQKKPYNPVTYTDADIIKLKEWIKEEEIKAIGDIKLGMTLNEFKSMTQKYNFPQLDHDSKEIYDWYNVEYKFNLSEGFAASLSYARFYKNSLYNVVYKIHKKSIAFVDYDAYKMERDETYAFLKKIFNVKYREQLKDLNIPDDLIHLYIMHEPSNYSKYDDISFGDTWIIGDKRILFSVVNDRKYKHDFNKIEITIYNQETSNKVIDLISNNKDKEVLDSVNKF